MRTLIKKILKEQTNPIKWVKPHFEDEEEEFMNHFLSWYEEEILKVDFTSISDEEYYQYITDLHYAYGYAKVEPLTDEEWSKVENTDSWGINSEEDLYDVVHGMWGRSKERISKYSIEPIKNGGVVETPIIVYSEGNPPYLVAGNTRLSACKVFGVRPMVTKVYL